MSKKINLIEKKTQNILCFSLCQYLFNSSIDKHFDDYLYEAKCQLLMYSAISIIKMNTIVNNFIIFILYLF